MNANELRLGNLFSVHSPIGVDVVYTVSAISETKIQTTAGIDCEIDKAQEIPIHENMLKIHGFRNTVNPTIFNCIDFPIYLVRDIGQPKGANRMFYFENGTTKLAMIQFFHQLQNLYFALTGDELTAKSNS